MKNKNKCPLCSNNCDRNHLGCEQGQAYFNGQNVQRPEQSIVNLQPAQRSRLQQQNNVGKCPLCANLCDANNLKCEQGHTYFYGGPHPDYGCNYGCHDEHYFAHTHGHHEHLPLNHHHPEYPQGSLPELLIQCGHKLFHSANDSMFTALTNEERIALKNLLTKLLYN